MNSRVEISESGKRIELYVDYEPGINILCKQVPGYKFDSRTKTWSYPLRIQTCHSLRSTFGDAMAVGPKLRAWAKDASKKQEKMKSLGSKMDSELSRVKESHPDLWHAMSSRPYQRSGAEFLAVTGVAANFDEPGLGKTAELIAAIIQSGNWNGRHLVVVSNKTAIRSTWEREIRKWTPDAKVYAMPDGWEKREKQIKAFLADGDGPRFMIILPHMLQIKVDKWCNKCKKWTDQEIPTEHYEKNHKFGQRDRQIQWPELFEIEWTSVIADECHDYLLKLRSPQTAGQPQWAYGMNRIGKKAKMRLPATGTPFRGNETNLYGILYWLDPVKYSSYWAWVETYFEVEDTQFSIRGGAGAKGHAKYVGKLKPEMTQKFYAMIDSLCLRRTRAEVRSDLPKEDIQEHWVPLEGEHKRQYEEFEERGYVMLESGVLEGMGRLSELTRIKQFAFGPWDVEYEWEFPDEGHAKIKMMPKVDKSPKVQMMIDMLRERGALRPVAEQPEDARKFIIASQYVTVIEGIRDLLSSMKTPSLVITGKQNATMRALAVKSFSEKGGPKILLLNTKAGGASLTLDAMCDEMFIMDETWIHDDQIQLIGRTNNRGSDIRQRTYHLFRTEETIDERIAIGNANQSDMQSAILDSRRGKEVGLSLLRRRA